MIMQTIKRWLHNMFAWWPWRKASKIEYTYLQQPLNVRGKTSEAGIRPIVDTGSEQPGIAHLTFGQNEVTCSTIDEWPERVVQPSNADTPKPIEKNDSLFPPLPVTPPVAPIAPIAPIAPVEARQEKPSDTGKLPLLDVPTTPTPAPEHHLEFLQYLVQRGIVNEGFTEGSVPEQYQRNV